MRYIFFVVDQQSRSANGDEMAAIDAFNDKLRANGHWILAIGIGAPNTATTIDNRSGANRAESGSIFNSDDFYSGLWLIETASSEEASALAREASLACNRVVEMRPLL
jgi:hypothetical protein